MKVPPWLAHLRTDDRGRPVPYVNRWGLDEDAAGRWSIEHDPNVGQPGLFWHDDGPPDFLHQSPQRQREVVSRGLCQVCGRPVPWSQRLLVVSTISVEKITVDTWGNREAFAITEPWLDQQCARFAMEKCPGLIRRRHDEDLALIVVSGPQQVKLVVSSGWIEGPLEAESRRLQPAMWCKIVVPVQALLATGTKAATTRLGERPGSCGSTTATVLP